MPLLVPYGDPQTHGTLAKTLTFRRYRGKVVVEKKPDPTNPRTAGQIAQRTLFSSGWDAWKVLSTWEIEYLQKQAIQLNTSASNLFMSLWLRGLTWSKTPMNLIKEITDLNLPEPVSADTQGILHEGIAAVDTAPPPRTLGSIYDNDNSFISGMVASAYTRFYFDIAGPGPTPVTAPYGYPLLITYKDFADIEHVQLVRYPELIFPKTTVPSTTEMTDIKTVTAMQILQPVSPDLQGLFFGWYTEGESPPQSGAFCNIYDYENLLRIRHTNNPYQDTHLYIFNASTVTIDIPVDYIITINYLDFSDIAHVGAVYLPAHSFGPGDDLDLWLADDFSLYYDEPLTSLANSPVKPGPYRLFVSTDFSLYWDINMNLLASTPVV